MFLFAACSSAEPQDTAPLPAGWTRARVAQVIDGDTIEVRPLQGAELPATRVRLIGVDTPEVYGPVEEYGEKASQYTKRELNGRIVWLEKDVSETDPYDRSLRYVWLAQPRTPGDGMSEVSEVPEESLRRSLFNARLLLDGYARLATYPPDVKYVDFLRRFEREARQAERGLWRE